DWRRLPYTMAMCAGIPDAFFSLSELAESQGKSVHVFTALARILHDPDLQTIGDTSEEGMYGWTMRNHGASIMKYMADWTFDVPDQREVGRKVEEVCWGNTTVWCWWMYEEGVQCCFLHVRTHIAPHDVSDGLNTL
ncbi:hypothetical protein DXG01_009412, partial [Tephrocybe rancida]